MTRTVRDTNLETRAARLRLPTRPKPYWRLLETGLHLGYRRVKEGGGSWIARRLVGERRYREIGIGTVDDQQDADGVAIRSFSQAQAAAREWWRVETRRDSGHVIERGPYTVSDALRDYFAERERRGSKGLGKDKSAAQARILPTLGGIVISRLTTARIRDWQAALATSPRLARKARCSIPAPVKPLPVLDKDAMRAKQATANRTLTVLKAALNYAFQEGHADTDQFWRKAKPFREADAPIVQFLTQEECLRLVNATQGAFRDLVRAALLTGCRYGELIRLQVRDINLAAGTITVQESKAGKPRHVVLTDEGVTLLSGLAAGRVSRDLVFLRDDGRPWGPSHQQRPLEAASRVAKLDPPATFHILRHTYASSLAMRGVPMGVIAAQLGHADTRMTERHYAHLAPNYVATTVRAALPSTGFVDQTNVVPLAHNRF